MSSAKRCRDSAPRYTKGLDACDENFPPDQRGSAPGLFPQPNPFRCPAPTPAPAGRRELLHSVVISNQLLLSAARLLLANRSQCWLKLSASPACYGNLATTTGSESDLMTQDVAAPLRSRIWAPVWVFDATCWACDDCWRRPGDFQKGLDDANACLELLPEHLKTLGGTGPNMTYVCSRLGGCFGEVLKDHMRCPFWRQWRPDYDASMPSDTEVRVCMWMYMETDT